MKTVGRCRRLRHPAGVRGGFLAAAALAALAVLAPAAFGHARATAHRAAVPSTVTVGLSLKVSNLDPDLAVEPSNLDALHLIAGTLTELPGKGGAVQPGLAKSWKVAANGLTVTFNLRPGLTFSDGSALGASDVVASFQRFLTDKANVNAGLLAPIKSVAAQGNAVVFKLKSRYPSFPTVVGEPAFPVFPAKGIASPKQFLKKPISAGPYQIGAWNGSNITLVRNPRYAGAKPVVQTIKFVTVIDPNTRVVQLRGGQIDIADNLPGSVIPQLSGATRPVVTPIYGGVYLYVNNRHAPLNDSRVRRAISLAMNRDQLNSIAFAGKSHAMDSFFPGTMHCCHLSAPPIKQDIAKAKALLAGTACANGCNLKLSLRNGLDYADRAGVVVQQDLKAIGINASIEQVDPSVAGKAEGDGTFDLEVNGLNDYVDIPDGMLTYGLISTGGIDALFSGYKSKAMDAASLRAISSQGAARTAAIKQVEKIFAKDMPFVPLIDLSLITGTRLASNVVYVGTTSFYEVQRQGG